MQARIARPVSAFQADTHTGLENSITLADALTFGIIASTIERVRNRTRQLAADIARQLGICIQSDDVLDVREVRYVPHDAGETFTRLVVSLASQDCVQIGKLAPLALIAHPNMLFGIPAARTMEQVKNVTVWHTRTATGFTVTALRSIFGIQRFNSRLGLLH